MIVYPASRSILSFPFINITRWQRCRERGLLMLVVVKAEQPVWEACFLSLDINGLCKKMLFINFVRHMSLLRKRKLFAFYVAIHHTRSVWQIPSSICKNADAESTYHHTRGTYTQPQINRTRQDELKARLCRSLFAENDIYHRTGIQINRMRQVATTHHPQQRSSPSSFVSSYKFTSRIFILYFQRKQNSFATFSANRTDLTPKIRWRGNISLV